MIYHQNGFKILLPVNFWVRIGFETYGRGGDRKESQENRVELEISCY